SRFSTPRPDTMATAPPVSRLSASSKGRTRGSTTTASGVAASSASVPSKSKKNAASAKAREAGGKAEGGYMDRRLDGPAGRGILPRFGGGNSFLKGSPRRNPVETAWLAKCGTVG